MSELNGFSGKPTPNFETMVEVGEAPTQRSYTGRWRHVIPRIDKDTTIEFLREWFDPAPQLKEMCQVSFWKDILVEAMALGYILIAVILLLNACSPALAPYPLIIGVFAAFMIFSSVDGWGPMCGCLLNPAGIVGFYLCGRMSFVRAVFRILGEFGGAAAGAMIGYGLVPEDNKSKVFALKKSELLTLTQAGAVEGILTFNLILVALSVTTPGKHTILHTLTIGCCKATGLLAAGSYTGGIQNPAIAMGPAVASKDFKDHFAVYWLGPFIGGVVAAIVYRIVQYINHRDAELKEREEVMMRRASEASLKTTTLGARGRSDSQVPCTEAVEFS